MPRVLDTVNWPEFSVAAAGWLIAAACMAAIVRGHLIPRQTHQDALHDRDEWRAESRIKDQQIREKDEQLALVSEVGRTVNDIMRAVGAARREGDQR